jgi:glycosyltransferase involved in cell wall biosynthesis
MNEKDFILLIPCYNNYYGLVNSIRSIQYPNNRFEILIVDDGSDIPLNQQNLKDLKPGINIKIIRLPENKGILAALNTGLKALHTRKDFNYIARLDCGDLCHPNRFTEQIAFLDEHPEIGLSGTWCRFNELASGKSYLYKTKTKHNDILKEMHFKCSFIHPTVMFRREIIDIAGYYPEGYPFAEDYAYFWMILKKTHGGIIPETLVDVEYSGNNISAQNYRKQLKTRMKVLLKFFNNWLYLIFGISLISLKYILPIKMNQRIKFKEK